MNADELLTRLQDEAVIFQNARHRIAELAEEYCDIDNMDLANMCSEPEYAVRKTIIAHDSILSAIIYLRDYIKDGGI